MDMKRERISTRAVAVLKDNIDTDEIIPARFLKTVNFHSLADQAFADVRMADRDAGMVHPLDDPAFAQAQILISGKNFGCGSSREHAPQALIRWNQGIRAIVAESFAEIFFSNCAAMGIPCVRLVRSDVGELAQMVKADPNAEVTIDLSSSTVSCGTWKAPLILEAQIAQRLIDGTWDTTANLLFAAEKIRLVASRLPYVSGW